MRKSTAAETSTSGNDKGHSQHPLSNTIREADVALSEQDELRGAPACSVWPPYVFPSNIWCSYPSLSMGSSGKCFMRTSPNLNWCFSLQGC